MPHGVLVFAFSDIHEGLVGWVLGQTPRLFSSTSICTTDRCVVQIVSQSFFWWPKNQKIKKSKNQKIILNERFDKPNTKVKCIVSFSQTVIVTVSGVTYFMWDILGSKCEDDKVCENPRQIQHINTTPHIIERFISTFWKFKSRSYSSQFHPPYSVWVFVCVCVREYEDVYVSKCVCKYVMSEIGNCVCMYTCVGMCARVDTFGVHQYQRERDRERETERVFVYNMLKHSLGNL